MRAKKKIEKILISIGPKARYIYIVAGVALFLCGPLTQILNPYGLMYLNLYATDDTNLCKSSFVRIKE